MAHRSRLWNYFKYVKRTIVNMTRFSVNKILGNTMIDNRVCEVCPTIDLTHDSGVISKIKYCIMDAAMKDARSKYEVCGLARVIEYGNRPSEVVESNVVDEVVVPVEVKHERISRKDKKRNK